MRVPNHIAIILDGNGRWAKAKGAVARVVCPLGNEYPVAAVLESP